MIYHVLGLLHSEKRLGGQNKKEFLPDPRVYHQQLYKGIADWLEWLVPFVLSISLFFNEISCGKSFGTKSGILGSVSVIFYSNHVYNRRNHTRDARGSTQKERRGRTSCCCGT